ncbi:MAG: hypothetical protein LBC42_02555 [Puniceicoccales bacterium]|jgi:hypothetical protein|nr:hypothetical protein [Puniceicoccales bacterium]
MFDNPLVAPAPVDLPKLSSSHKPNVFVFLLKKVVTYGEFTRLGWQCFKGMGRGAITGIVVVCVLGCGIPCLFIFYWFGKRTLGSSDSFHIFVNGYTQVPERYSEDAMDTLLKGGDLLKLQPEQSDRALTFAFRYFCGDKLRRASQVLQFLARVPLRPDTETEVAILSEMIDPEIFESFSGDEKKQFLRLIIEKILHMHEHGALRLLRIFSLDIGDDDGVLDLVAAFTRWLNSMDDEGMSPCLDDNDDIAIGDDTSIFISFALQESMRSLRAIAGNTDYDAQAIEGMRADLITAIFRHKSLSNILLNTHVLGVDDIVQYVIPVILEGDWPEEQLQAIASGYLPDGIIVPLLNQSDVDGSSYINQEAARNLLEVISRRFDEGGGSVFCVLLRQCMDFIVTRTNFGDRHIDNISDDELCELQCTSLQTFIATFSISGNDSSVSILKRCIMNSVKNLSNRGALVQFRAIFQLLAMPENRQLAIRILSVPGSYPGPSEFIADFLALTDRLGWRGWNLIRDLWNYMARFLLQQQQLAGRAIKGHHTVFDILNAVRQFFPPEYGDVCRRTIAAIEIFVVNHSEVRANGVDIPPPPVRDAMEIHRLCFEYARDMYSSAAPTPFFIATNGPGGIDLFRCLDRSSTNRARNLQVVPAAREFVRAYPFPNGDAFIAWIRQMQRVLSPADATKLCTVLSLCCGHGNAAAMAAAQLRPGDGFRDLGQRFAVLLQETEYQCVGGLNALIAHMYTSALTIFRPTFATFHDFTRSFAVVLKEYSFERSFTFLKSVPGYGPAYEPHDRHDMQTVFGVPCGLPNRQIDDLHTHGINFARCSMGVIDFFARQLVDYHCTPEGRQQLVTSFKELFVTYGVYDFEDCPVILRTLFAPVDNRGNLLVLCFDSESFDLAQQVAVLRQAIAAVANDDSVDIVTLKYAMLPLWRVPAVVDADEGMNPYETDDRAEILRAGRHILQLAEKILGSASIKGTYFAITQDLYSEIESSMSSMIQSNCGAIPNALASVGTVTPDAEFKIIDDQLGFFEPI